MTNIRNGYIYNIGPDGKPRWSPPTATGGIGATGATGLIGATGIGATGLTGATWLTGATGPSTLINATAVTTNSTFYPVFVAAAGSNQTPSVDTTATALAYNPSTNVLTAGVVLSDKYRASSSLIVAESGTSRTLSSSDDGIILQCTSNSAVTITVPTDLDVGFTITIIQVGTGQITLSASGTTINNRQSHTKTAGQWAIVSLIQRTANNFVLAGDTAA